jgi:hypothetical protein
LWKALGGGAGVSSLEFNLEVGVGYMVGEGGVAELVELDELDELLRFGQGRGVREGGVRGEMAGGGAGCGVDVEGVLCCYISHLGRSPCVMAPSSARKSRSPWSW